ncbi:MAG: DMT family protein [Zoogloeaceae bacterium]|nr:DMT family protein [Zoogloeaceae bacterium]
MHNGLYAILLLIVSNTFMTVAWYGHLRFADKIREIPVVGKWGLLAIILVSWLIAFFEYCAQVPANRIGFAENGGPFDMTQLKVIQEVVSLTVFALLSTALLKSGGLHWNHLAAFACLVGAVFFVFWK